MKPILSRAIVFFVLLCFLVGCAGRTPYPVKEYQYGDEAKSCNHLRAEVSDLKSDIELKLKTSDSTSTKNVALGVTGVILFWPALFFMDLSDADKIELEALRRRHNSLLRISGDKRCGFDMPEIEFEKPKPVENKAEVSSGETL